MMAVANFSHSYTLRGPANISPRIPFPPLRAGREAAIQAGGEVMPEKLKASVNPDLCVGNGMCVIVAPDVFRLNEARKSEVMDQEAAGGQEVLEAAGACPVGAITVVDAETGEQLFP